MSSNKPIWQRKFNSCEEYELARTGIMIQLTQRALDRDPNDETMRSQLKRLEISAQAWKARIPKTKKVDKRKKRR